MTRLRLAGAILAGLLIGFFLTLAVVSLRDSGVPRSSADAAGASAANRASAGFGAMQAATHLAGVRHAYVVPFVKTLHVGSSGVLVRQLQRALRAAHLRPTRATGHFGGGTAAELRRFQRAHRIRPVTGRYGPKTHHLLSRYYDTAGRGALAAYEHSRVQRAYFAAISHAASVAWLHRLSMAYSQGGSRAFLPYLPLWPRATDCSGYATWLYKVSHLPDPSGFSYRIVGYTGTLAQHGARISASAAFHVGDLVFYGGGYPYGHVAIVVDAFRRLVSSHGSPGIKVVPFNYRPVSAVRRYF